MASYTEKKYQEEKKRVERKNEIATAEEQQLEKFIDLLLSLITGKVVLDEDQQATVWDNYDRLPEPQQATVRERLFKETGVQENFKSKSEVGSVPGFTPPTPNMEKFNWVLLSDKFEKSDIYPVKDASEKVITSGFGYRNLGYGSKHHPAFDLRASAGAEVVSIYGGDVVKVGQIDITIRNKDKDGNYNGTCTTYFHVDGHFKPGDSVSAGQTIATVLPKCGKNPYAPHLDVRTYDAQSGIFISPEAYMDMGQMRYKDQSEAEKLDCVLMDKSAGKYLRKEQVAEELASRGLQASESLHLAESEEKSDKEQASAAPQKPLNLPVPGSKPGAVLEPS